MKKRRKKGLFAQYFLVFQLVLILGIAAALIYVHSLLTEYEKAQPERLVEEAISELVEKAESRTLFDSSALNTDGTLEEGMDLQKIYCDLLTDPETRYTPKAGLHAENTAVYSVKTKEGVTLAEITLEAVGEPVTKLAVFTWQEWKINSVTPLLEAKDYTLTLPFEFTAAVNGITLTAANGTVTETGDILYTIENLHFAPEVKIISDTGEEVSFSIKNNRIIPVVFDYDLTLPSAFTLTLNGQQQTGATADNGYTTYKIRLLTKPEVIISDPFGNAVNYEGGNTLPLTILTVNTTDRHTVTVDGASVPDSMITTYSNPEYESFEEYVSDLPKLADYKIAVLKNDPYIVVTDPNGNPFTVNNSIPTHDMTHTLNFNMSPEVIPADISAEVDPMEIAKKWSLFVSKDLTGANYGLQEIAQYLIPSSYQYKIATNYAYGIDITFTSIHTLKNPPFTDEKVSNFVQITDNCFSVDVSFTKHMILSNGTEIADTMTERLYFVKYDDPASDWDTPAWKLASMKEMSNNAE